MFFFLITKAHIHKKIEFFCGFLFVEATRHAMRKVPANVMCYIVPVLKVRLNLYSYRSKLLIVRIIVFNLM